MTEKQQKFVCHYVKTGGDNATASARAAGYFDDGPGIRTTAYRLLHSRKIIEAIREDTGAALSTEDLTAARRSLAEMIRDPQHKDHFDAVKLAMGIAGLSPTIKNEHVHTVDAESLADQIKYLEAQLPATLLKRLQAPKIIDAEDWTAA